MFPKMKFLVASLTFLSLLPSSAQTKEQSKEKSCRVIYLQRPQDAPTGAYLFDGAVSHKVELPGMNFSEVVNLPAGDITLGMTPGPVDAPENFPKGAPMVKVPAHVMDLYLIVGSDPTNAVLPIRMLALDVSTGKLKPGETIWVNLTGHRIAAKLGDESLDVPPGGRAVGKAPLKASGYYNARFAYQPRDGKELLPIMSKSWWHDAKSKHLGFIIESGGRLPRIFVFRDFRDEPIVEPKEGGEVAPVEE